MTAKKLRTLLQQNGLTQSSLAREMGLSHFSVRNWFRRGVPQKRKDYTSLRREIAEALSMYAFCLHNPIDLAGTPNHKLTEFYKEGSEKLRLLAYKTTAFVETTPDNAIEFAKGVPSKENLRNAVDCLYGLSNSFYTPYGCYIGPNDLADTLEFESELRKILSIQSQEVE